MLRETNSWEFPPPFMETTCGLLVAESEIVRVPGIEPVVAGVNTTVIVQAGFVGNELPPVAAVRVELDGLAVMPLRAKATFCRFVIVTVRGWLGVPTSTTWLNGMEVGETVT